MRKQPRANFDSTVFDDFVSFMDRSPPRGSNGRFVRSIAETRLRITELDTERINEVVQELRDAQTQQFDLVEKILAAEDVLRRTAILAPLDGVVLVRVLDRQTELCDHQKGRQRNWRAWTTCYRR